MKISKHLRRPLALLLCLILAVGLLPVGAMAVSQTAPSENGLGLTKTVTAKPDADGDYTLSLEAYTTGEVTMATQAVPTDVVLVLDQSGSMTGSFGSVSKQAALKTSVVGFINSVADKYSATANHKVGIVTFGNGSTNLIEMTAADAAGKAALVQKVNSLPSNPSGATDVAAGMTAANAMLPAVTAGRNRIAIVFTDGVPTTESDFSVTVANNALTAAKSMKDAGVKVFTIGIFPDAKVSQLHGEKFNYLLYSDVPCSGAVGSIWGNSGAAVTFGDVLDTDTPAGNRFLNYLSNNAPTAASIGLAAGRYDPRGTGIKGYGFKITENALCDTNAGFYLTASNTAALENVFQTISGTILSPTINLDSTTIVRDVVTDTFRISAAPAKPIKAYKVPYAGGNTWGAPVDITGSVTINTAVDGTVDVSGYDFNTNMVYDGGGSFGGAKLLINIPIRLKDDIVLPANQIPTNSVHSGVISNGTSVANFPVPEVTLYTVTFKNYDESVLKTQIVVPGEGAAAPADPVRTGYTFMCWDAEFSSISSDLTVTALFERDDSQWHTVTFKPSTHSTLNGADAAGQVVVADILKGTAWSEVWVPGVNYSTGYMAGTPAWSGTFPATVTENLTFTATEQKDPTQWFTITFKPSANSTLAGADVAGKVIVADVCNGTAWNDTWVPAVSYATGYTAGTPAWDAVFPATVTGNLTFTATQINNSNERFSVLFTAGEHGSLEGTSSFNDIISGTAFETAVTAIPTPVSENGYMFEKWTPNLPEAGTTVTANMSFVASFVKDASKWHTVTFTAGSNGSLTGTASFADILSGSVFSAKITVPTPEADAGYKFAGWEPALPETNSTIISNQAYRAVFTADEYPINDGASMCYKQVNGASVPAGYKARFELYRVFDTYEELAATGETGTFEGNRAPIIFTEAAIPMGGNQARLMVAPVASALMLPAGIYKLVEVSAPEIGGYTKSAPTYTNEGMVIIGPDGRGVVCTNTYTSTTIYWPPIDPPVIPDDDVPLGPPTLNRTDHFAYIVGRTDGLVAPEANITRAEVATIFFRMLTDKSRIEIWKATNGFSDVKADQWFNNAVSTLAGAKILDGYGDGSFKPNAPITRAEFATIATRFYDAPGTYVVDAFNDISNHWAKNYINRAAELKLVNGYDDGSFKPEKLITRAEAIQMVNSILGRTPSKDGLMTGMKTWKDNADTSKWYYAAVQEATNNHEFKMVSGTPLSYEQWTKLLPNRDWEKLETQWAQAAAAAGR